MENKKINYRTVKNYHQQTKHHPQRYARSLRYMDWENMPKPFRFYKGAERISLTLQEKEKKLPYNALYEGISQPILLSYDSLAIFLEFSLGLSTWKKHKDSQWSLRMNPSSGNLHPTECYLLLPEMDNRKACIAHYNPYLHCLEEISTLSSENAKKLNDIKGFGVILTSIHWREAWKYGERAFRYCHHDIGHALGCLRFAAQLNGWFMRLQTQIADEVLDQLLGFDKLEWVKCEQEHADCLCWVSGDSFTSENITEYIHSLQTLKCQHAPNRLSKDHHHWETIDKISVAVKSPGEEEEIIKFDFANIFSCDVSFSAQEIIRKRRSAQKYDRESSHLDWPVFAHMLEQTLPTSHCPFDLFPYRPNVHLIIFVHNIHGITPGLYCFVRNPDDYQELVDSLTDNVTWKQITPNFPLYLLQEGNAREVAQAVSCNQEIAGESAFSLGMLTRFEKTIENKPWKYPRLFWETGLIGQVLYLEAEANNLRATGIGCYFDDLLHQLLGIKDDNWQSLYHFTIGKHIDDDRIQIKPPYHHLRKVEKNNIPIFLRPVRSDEEHSQSSETEE